jgi:asparagine synthase (glutamine-hydrolysing)
MCGVVAIWGSQDESLVGEMLARIRHRGPDGQGRARVGRGILGHRRLAIVDVDGGAQPMANERGDLLVAFNGEIYNHLELRSHLEGRHRFRTRSDTEVLLHLYEDVGEDMLARLDGMFAIALAGPHGLLLARDPLGIKPLYYGRRGQTVIAASELKAFPPMDEIRMLPAGHAILVDGREWRFSPPYPPAPALVSPSLDEVLDEIRRRLDHAVVKRLMSDVPVGVYLSGGLDSSVVAALMRPHAVRLHSFTAGMEGAPDIEAAREVARFLGTEHHEMVYTPADVQSALPLIIRCLESFDAPLVRSAVPMYFVSRLAAEHVKVVLSGEGADELFAGYAYLAGLGGGDRLRHELDAITVRLQDTNLQRADRVSMAHGLEARVPFLDLDLVRYVRRLPIEFVQPAEGRSEKWLLREACRGLLPPQIEQRKKMKFSDGAGSGEVMAEIADAGTSAEAFERERQVEPGLRLRSPEELLYYRIWRDVAGQHLPSSVVGRTQDRTAAGGREDEVRA